MQKTVNKLALISLFAFSFALSACSTPKFMQNWFGDDEPLPSELGRHAPMMNSSQPQAFPDPMNANYANAPIDATMPPMGMPMGGGMPPVPEPPLFIGSNNVQRAPQTSPDVFATPMPPQQSYASLPMASPVDMSAAENAAVGLPMQRRAPAFNQSLAMPAAAGNAVSPIAPMSMPPQKLAQMPPAPPIPTVHAMPPMANSQSADEFPKLAQIPPNPSVVPNAAADARVQSLKADLNSANKRAANSDEMVPMPQMPIAPVVAESRRPAAPQNVASTDFTKLKPLSNEPIYKVSPEPQTLGGQAFAAAPVPARSVTRLQDLHPIAAQRGRVYSASTGKATAYKNVGKEARHSTYYGEY